MSAAFSRRLRTRKLKSEINVVPYIDVMLVLLVIFMITAPLLNLGVDIDLPESNAQGAASQAGSGDDQVDKRRRLPAQAARPGQRARSTCRTLGVKIKALAATNPDIA